jgi:hypothetical protein
VNRSSHSLRAKASPLTSNNESSVALDAQVLIPAQAVLAAPAAVPYPAHTNPGPHSNTCHGVTNRSHVANHFVARDQGIAGDAPVVILQESVLQSVLHALLFRESAAVTLPTTSWPGMR